MKEELDLPIILSSDAEGNFFDTNVRLGCGWFDKNNDYIDDGDKDPTELIEKYGKLTKKLVIGP